jgi:hypothetical protein
MTAFLLVAENPIRVFRHQLEVMNAEQIRESKKDFEIYATEQNQKTTDPQLRFQNTIQLAIVNLLGEIAAQLADLKQKDSQSQNNHPANSPDAK